MIIVREIQCSQMIGKKSTVKHRKKRMNFETKKEAENYIENSTDKSFKIIYQYETPGQRFLPGQITINKCNNELHAENMLDKKLRHLLGGNYISHKIISNKEVKK